MERLRAGLAPLARRYDAVVANPPYMGSSSLGRWMGSWVKKRYPEAYRDLCTAFIDRGFSLGAANGYSAMVTMQSWMFLGSFEKLRCRILGEHSVSSMAHLGTRAFGAIAGEVVSTAATVFANAKSEVEGAYFRLVDMGSEAEKREGLLQALADPDCGWFYRADARDFGAIPGSPVAYWASDNFLSAFEEGANLGIKGRPKIGIKTGLNESFVRNWWEVSSDRTALMCGSISESKENGKTWFAYNKGGAFRKWYGNSQSVVLWENGGMTLEKKARAIGVTFSAMRADLQFRESILCNLITSDQLSFRFKEKGILPDIATVNFFPEESTLTFLAFGNSTVCREALSFLAPTLNNTPGDLSKIPWSFKLDRAITASRIGCLCRSNIDTSKTDWDSRETSWNFERHRLV